MIEVTNKLDGPNDGPPGSLRNAISLANNFINGYVTIKFMVHGTFVLTEGELELQTNIRLVNNTCKTVIITTNNSNRLLHITNGEKIKISNIQFTGGNTNAEGGAIYVSAYNHVLTLDNVIVNKNTAERGGGVFTNGKLKLYNSFVVDNSAASQGGGIWSLHDIKLYESRVNNNKVTTVSASNFAGGIFVYAGNLDLCKSKVNCNKVIYDETSGGFSGGILVLLGNITFEESELVDNSAWDFGGATVVGGKITVNNSFAKKNESIGLINGGGAFGVISSYDLVTPGSSPIGISIYKSQIVENKTNGLASAAVGIIYGSIVVRESTISKNKSRGPGGGISANIYGSVLVTDSCISGNSAGAIGAGISKFGNGSVIVRCSKITDNNVTDGTTFGAVMAAYVTYFNALLPIFNVAINSASIAETTTLNNLITNITTIITDAGTELAALVPNPYNVIAGGGIGTLSASILTIDSEISNNSATQITDLNTIVGNGGGLFSYNSTITVQTSKVNYNRSYGSGGGIWSNILLQINKSCVDENKSTRINDGGGIFITGTADIINTTMTKNKTLGNGGAISLTEGSVLTLSDSTICSNTAGIDGGGIFLNSGILVQLCSKIKNNDPNDIA